MKQMYWIDDNIQQMLNIMQGAITKLWKIEEENAEGIASNVIIFGNACDDSDTDDIASQEDENDAKVRLEDLLQDLCGRLDGPNKEKPAYNARKELVEDKVNFLYKKENPDDKNQYQNMKRAWITEELQESEGDKYKKAAEEAEKLVERMNIGKEAVVGIDISLLYGDLDRLRNKQRIISMELYHILSDGGLKCFMYSSEADDDELVQNWNQVCSSLYQTEDAKIYKRSSFMQKGKEDVITEIESMFN